MDDGKAVITLTTVQDAAKVTALAVEYAGEWPRVSGIKGGDVSMRDLVAIGEKARGNAAYKAFLFTSSTNSGCQGSNLTPSASQERIS